MSIEFNDEQKAEMQRLMNEQAQQIAQRTALFENTLTFMELALNRSKQFGDRAEVYNAGCNLFNLVAKPQPPQQENPQQPPQKAEPTE